MRFYLRIICGAALLCLFACNQKQNCLKVCEQGYKECMQRVTEPERCGFMRADCINRCEK